MFELKENILDFFFEEIKKKGKYTIRFDGNGALIIPRDEEQYYKPVIVVKDLTVLEKSLLKYIEHLNNFYCGSEYLLEHHNLSFFFNNLFFNMTNSDAMDLAKYIDKRNSFFENDCFDSFSDLQLFFSDGDIKFYVQRILEHPGLESPYILEFSMDIHGVTYQLPLVRYAIDDNNICHLFAIQFGRRRINNVQPEDYKNAINSINRGVKKYRNVQPSFVLIFKLFLIMLKEKGVQQIVAPDYLFARYKQYYKSSGSVRKSDIILTRILDQFLVLLQRMEYQFSGFVIENYPNEIDSYTHIKLDDSLGKLLKK